MKDKATVCFRRLQSGEVMGEIIGEDGTVLHSRNLGLLDDDELDRVLQAFQEENPGVFIMPVKLTGN
ncbi:MAG: hypothetical protein M0Z67_04300 [Nitrospiraceae bacterium]|nr:hypothetical protein [Nitrospiraceae bacterium]